MPEQPKKFLDNQENVKKAGIGLQASPFKEKAAVLLL
jgi:hypothetical protein